MLIKILHIIYYLLKIICTYDKRRKKQQPAEHPQE